MIFTYPNDFWHKEKINNFDPYDVLLLLLQIYHATYDWFLWSRSHKCTF